jgi:thiol-disulfide isomerase/thioredoxin
MVFTTGRSYHPLGLGSISGYNQAMSRWFATILLLVEVAVMVVTVSLPAHGAKGPSFEGEQIEFTLTDLDGQVVSSSDPRFEGNVLLIDLWATYCPPCLTEIPTFIELQDRLGERGLVVIGIAFEAEKDPPERRSRLKEFAREREINYLILDGGNWSALPDALPGLRGVRGMPVEIFVDRDLRVVEVRNGYGYKKRWARKLEATLTELIDAGRREGP